jgi:anaerobic magnesium-protoporphyrin IX monomethyl ester cyclase
MADILFAHSYFLKFDSKEYATMMPYAPLGTLYAAAAVRVKGYSVALFDCMLAEREEDIITHIEKNQPKVVVIYDDDFNYLTKMCLTRMREAAFTMSRLAKEHGCTVVVHGSDPADNINEYINHGADYVVIGEGEVTLCELLDQLFRSSSKKFENIHGLAYRNNGSVLKNPKRSVFTDLDLLPHPAWDLIDVENYRHLWNKRHGYFSMNMVTTRGCPFHCNWCAKPIYGQVYHSRSPEHVVEEMLWMKSTFHPDHVWFCDDIFGLKPGWVPKLADAVVKQQATIPFKCLSRADLLLDDNTVSHLARAGCQTVWIGAESGSQKILDAMEKGTTVEQIYASTKLMREHGINVGFFLQYGYSGERQSDIDLTLKMLKECKPDEIGISVSYPLPGTKFYERVKQELGEKKNWIDSKDLDMMYSGTYSTEFYRTLHTVTHKKFRIWQGMDLLSSTLDHPFTLNRKKIRRIAASAYHALTLPSLEKKLTSLTPTVH